MILLPETAPQMQTGRRRWMHPFPTDNYRTDNLYHYVVICPGISEVGYTRKHKPRIRAESKEGGGRARGRSCSKLRVLLRRGTPCARFGHLPPLRDAK